MNWLNFSTTPMNNVIIIIITANGQSRWVDIIRYVETIKSAANEPSYVSPVGAADCLLIPFFCTTLPTNGCDVVATPPQLFLRCQSQRKGTRRKRHRRPIDYIRNTSENMGTKWSYSNGTRNSEVETASQAPPCGPVHRCLCPPLPYKYTDAKTRQ